MAGAQPAAPETEGWKRRFVAGGPRLEEAEMIYRQLGFDVRLAPPAVEDLRGACGDCRLALELFRVVYTRRLP